MSLAARIFKIAIHVSELLKWYAGSHFYKHENNISIGRAVRVPQPKNGDEQQDLDVTVLCPSSAAVTCCR